MSENLTRREWLLWSLGFGAAAVAAAASGVAISRREHIARWLGFVPDGAPAESRAIEISNSSELADIIEKSKETPVFMSMPLEEYSEYKAFHDVSRRYKDVLFAQCAKKGPELPKEWGKAETNGVVFLYQEERHVITGKELSTVGKDGADAFEVIVEDNLRLHRPRNLVALTKSNYRGYLGMDRITFVDLWAGSCVFCKPVKKVFEELAADGYDHKKYQFAEYDVSLKLPLSKEWDVGSIPQVAVVRNGKLVGPLISPVQLYTVWNNVPEEEKRKENLNKILKEHIATYMLSYK